MVALSVAFYARLSVGSRQIVEIFNILNEFMGNVFGKVPAYTMLKTEDIHPPKTGISVHFSGSLV